MNVKDKLELLRLSINNGVKTADSASSTGVKLKLMQLNHAINTQPKAVDKANSRIINKSDSILVDNKNTKVDNQENYVDKDEALQAAIEHLEGDSEQPDIPESEQSEDAGLVETLKKALSQKERYPKIGGVEIAGIPIALENPEHSTREGVDQDGTPWSITMKDHYGYIEGIEGADGDELDCFLKPGTQPDWDGDIYVIEQNNPKTGDYDEDKVMIGYGSPEEAKAAYMRNYAEGWQGFGDMLTFTIDDFMGNAESGEFVNVSDAQGDSWITVHPNGKDSTGQPVLIGEDGTVKAGMGGKFNGKDIRDAHGTKEFTSHETNAETDARHAEKAESEKNTLTEPEKSPIMSPNSTQTGDNKMNAPTEPVTVSPSTEGVTHKIPSAPQESIFSKLPENTSLKSEFSEQELNGVVQRYKELRDKDRLEAISFINGIQKQKGFNTEQKTDLASLLESEYLTHSNQKNELEKTKKQENQSHIKSQVDSIFEKKLNKENVKKKIKEQYNGDVEAYKTSVIKGSELSSKAKWNNGNIEGSESEIKKFLYFLEN